MMKKVSAIVLSLMFALSPVTVFAKGYTVKVGSLRENVTLSEGYISEKDLKSGDVDEVKYNPENQSDSDNVPDIGAKAVYLIHPESGKVIFQKNAFEKVYPASTTKIMTALMALENCDMDDTVVVSEKALSLVPSGYSSSKLEAGEKFSVYTLLQALLIPSGNEAANALAQHISGNIDDFAKLCNKRAEELGCKVLHFVNPNGVHKENHYCCAYDMYLIANECKKYDAFNEIVKSTSFTVPATNIHPEEDRVMQNTNRLLLKGSGYYYEYCTGIKTGHTEEAGECLVSSASKDGIDLVCVVLGGKVRSDGLNERFYDTKRLYEFAYDNYGYITAAEKDDVFASIKIENATKETANLDLTISEDITSFAPIDMKKDDVKANITLLEDIKAPIKQGQALGSITFEVDGFEYTADLVAKTDVERNNTFIYLAIVFVISLIITFIITSKDKKKNRR
ncbi:MAG: D-alanyl-D-alanine carboxypeptidase [Clostridia bacterium]|nr:D-alanyl-D-alanine carboxypeptidase [Clostridia bacterium]